MIRTTFDRENELTGEDFANLIERLGGKGAGLKLLEAGLISEFEGKLEVPPYSCIPTSIGMKAEQILLDTIPNPAQWYRENFPKDSQWVETQEDLWRVNSHLNEGDGETLDAFLKNLELNALIKDVLKNYGMNDQSPFHLRSSTTTEDFRDDRYWGTFESVEYGTNLQSALLQVFWDFYIKKYHSSGHYELSPSDKLGLVLMESVGGRESVHATLYSRYPERPSGPTVIDLEQHYRWSSFVDTDPYQLLFVDEEKVTVNQSRSGMLVFPKKRNMHRISNQPTCISEDDAHLLRNFATYFEQELGYPVNFEIILDGKNIFPVQLRPVPTLPEDRPVKQLGPMIKTEHLYETPFVVGSYKISASLVRINHPEDYLYGFSEPVIMWHSEHGCKGSRFRDMNRIALLCPEEGFALSHSSKLIPNFGPERNRFALIGFPQLGSEFFEKYLQESWATPDTGGSYLVRQGKVEYTPFNITIESDGRYGRLFFDSSQIRGPPKTYLKNK